jgi:hypothetical protein
MGNGGWRKEEGRITLHNPTKPGLAARTSSTPLQSHSMLHHLFFHISSLAANDDDADVPFFLFPCFISISSSYSVRPLSPSFSINFTITLHKAKSAREKATFSNDFPIISIHLSLLERGRKD